MLRSLFFLAMLILAGCSERPRAEFEWDLSLPWSPQEFHTQNAIAFAERVYEETSGRLRITVHPGGTLGIKGPEALRVLGEGVVQMAEMPGVQQIGSAPILGLDSLPFLIRDQRDLRALDRLLRPALDQAFTDHGVKPLYRVPWPNQNLFFKQSIDGLDDMRGMKIRTYDRLSSDLMDRLGLVPVQMALGDVVPALASGVVDATMTSTTSASAQRYWEFLDVTLRTNHIWLINVMAVNRKAWDALPEDLKLIVSDIADQMEPDFWAISAQDDQAKLTVLENQGMRTIEPTDRLRAQMREAARPMWQEFVSEAGPEAQQILKRYLADRP